MKIIHKLILFFFSFLLLLPSFSESFFSVYAVDLPDLVPVNFTSCWQTNQNDPSSGLISYSFVERNNGGSAAAHLSMITRTITQACSIYPAGATSSWDESIQALGSGQQVTISRNPSSETIPLTCLQQGFVKMTVSVNTSITGPIGNIVPETDRSNNIATINSIQSCSPVMPDLIPTTLTVCYRIVGGGPRMDFDINFKEKNIGPVIAQAHRSSVSLNHNESCLNDGSSGIERWDIPILSSNQEYGSSRTTSRNWWSGGCGIQATFFADENAVVNESNENNNSSQISVPPCPVTCSASFTPTSGSVLQGQNFDLQGRIDSVSGGDGSGYDFIWSTRWTSGNYLYPPSVNPVNINTWYPGRWNSTPFVAGNYNLIFLAKNKSQSWNSAATCNGQAVVTVTVTPGVNPVGYFNTTDCNHIWGWAGDPDVPTSPVDIQLFINGPWWSGTYFGTISASQIREPGVCSYICPTCSCASCGTADLPQCRHGFSYTVPSWMMDGSPHAIYGYAINLPGTGGTNVDLYDSPQTINCSPPNNPWFQIKGGDVHAEGNIISPIPLTATVKVFNADLNGFPGLISLTGTANLTPANVVSSTKWLATDSFVTSLSYNYFYTKLGSPTVGNFSCLGNCPIPPAGGTILADGTVLYYSLDDITIVGQGWTIPNNTKVIVLVDKDLLIKKQITVPVGSFLMFIVKGNINIMGNVGDKNPVGTPHLQGVYFTEGTINTNSDNDTVSGVRLVAAGSFIAKGGFVLGRSLKGPGITNLTDPAEVFISRPDLIINAPNTLFSSSFSWQEVAP